MIIYIYIDILKVQNPIQDRTLPKDLLYKSTKDLNRTKDIYNRLKTACV